MNAWALSADGIDRHMAINYFGHFLLINRLLPLLRETAAMPNTPPPRIVSLSSELHKTCPSSVKFESSSEVSPYAPCYPVLQLTISRIGVHER